MVSTYVDLYPMGTRYPGAKTPPLEVRKGEIELLFLIHLPVQPIQMFNSI